MVELLIHDDTDERAARANEAQHLLPPVPIFIRTELVEAGPMGEPANSASGQPTTEGATILLSGDFQGADEFHFGRGQAHIVETPSGLVLRIENFSVLNGPDLHVYLSADSSGYTPDATDLGKLKATDGSFNYALPAGTDAATVASVVIWCEPFAVQFAHAPLAAP